MLRALPIIVQEILCDCVLDNRIAELEARVLSSMKASSMREPSASDSPIILNITIREEVQSSRSQQAAPIEVSDGEDHIMARQAFKE